MAGIPKRLPLFKPAVCFLQFSMSEPRPSCYLPCPLSVLVCNLSSSDKGRTELPTHMHGIFHFSVVFEMWFKYGLSTKQEVDQVTSQRSFLSCESVILLEWYHGSRTQCIRLLDLQCAHRKTRSPQRACLVCISSSWAREVGQILQRTCFKSQEFRQLATSFIRFVKSLFLLYMVI